MTEPADHRAGLRAVVILGVVLLILAGLFAASWRAEKMARTTAESEAAPAAAPPVSAATPKPRPTPKVELPLATSTTKPIPPAAPPRVPAGINPGSPVISPPPPLPPSPTGGDSPINDLFAPLRNSDPYPEDHWKQLDDAFRHLARVDGASYEKETGRLILAGPYTEEPGPFRLEDWCVALWGEFLSDGRLGMTIDPAEGRKLTVPMNVKFFGESRDTRFGQRMYECDWLLKGLSLGVEDVAPVAKRSQIDGFSTYIERAKGVRGGAREVWSRFWLALIDENRDAQKATVPIQLSKGGNTVFLPPPKLHACTETMLEDAQGGLRSGGGLQDPSAKGFVRHFNDHLEDFARLFPEVHQLRELSRLVLLARWIRENDVPFDYELLYLRFEGASVTTPVTAPVQSEGPAEFKVSGGVNFRAPKLETVPDRYNAEMLDAELKGIAARLPGHGGFSARSENRTNDRQYVILGPTTTGPPQSPLTQRPGARIGMQEAFGKTALAPANPAQTSQPRRRRPVIATQEASGKMTFGAARPPQLTAPFDPVVNPDSPNMPVMRSGILNGKPIRSEWYEVREEGTERLLARTSPALIPDFMYISSPMGDIQVRFGELKCRRASNEVYFECDVPGVEGYYPESRQLRFDNGGWARFDKFTGVVESVKVPNGPLLNVQFEFPHDGPLRIPDSSKDPVRNRGPPKAGENPNPPRSVIPTREATGMTKITAVPADVARWVKFSNSATGAAVTVSRVGGELVNVETKAAK